MADNKPSPVHLGFCEPTQDESTLAHRSPLWSDWDGGQVGGRPSWLNPCHLPNALTCTTCKDARPLRFIVQLYAPADTINSNAFHRSIYVFGCAKCSSIRVLRTQLPRVNPYYPINDCEEDVSFAEQQQQPWNKHLPETYGINLCQVCGQRGKGICPIQKVSFCGKHHQKEHKQHVHDVPTDQQQSSDKNLPSVYPLYELVVDEEEEEETENEERETMFETFDNDSDQDLSQDDLNAIVSGTTNGGTNDPTTVDFFCRTQTAKDQCVFYDRGRPSPLWLRSEAAPPQIPNCPYCHAPRQFEFQLQPQLLQYILHQRQQDNSSCSSIDMTLTQKEALLAACAIVNKTAPENLSPQFKETHDKALQRIQSQLLAKPKNELDWGIVAVYTCTASCGDFDTPMVDEELGAYREEYAYTQPSL